MKPLTYLNIPNIRIGLQPTGFGVARQQLVVARPGEDHSGPVRWAPVVLGASALYLFVAIARTWGPTGMAVVLPFALFGLTRVIYRAAALSLA